MDELLAELKKHLPDDVEIEVIGQSVTIKATLGATMLYERNGLSPETFSKYLVRSMGRGVGLWLERNVPEQIDYYYRIGVSARRAKRQGD